MNDLKKMNEEFSEGRTYSGTEGDYDIYSVGLLYLSVCSNIEQRRLVELIQEKYPSGTSHNWDIAEENFNTGGENPCACHDNAETHKHYLFTC